MNHDTAAGIAAISIGLVLFGITWRIAQAVLWLLEGHRS